MTAPSLLAAETPVCCADEKWEPVPDWPHESGTCGRVRSVDRIDASGRLRLGATLPQLPDSKGYLYVVLLDGKRRRRVHVAVAVLEAHRGLKPTSGHEACHRFGDNGDNHLDGLYWGTRRQNRADRERHRRERSCDRYPPETSQIRGFPRWARYVTRHSRSVTGDVTSSTGRSPSPSNLLSHSIPLNPSPHPVRTLLHALRNRQAA